MTEERRVLTYVEVDVDYCSLSYGVAPCTASVGVTGERKCFNTLSTCQDRENFTNVPVTLRFAVSTSYLPKDISAVPNIASVQLNPGIISLGEDLGQRTTLQVAFNDHPWSDTGPGYDKYYAERPYNPFEQGTYWGKFRTRQLYLRGRPIRLIRGILGQTIEEMETRHYVIDTFDMGADGTYSITAKDALKLADGDRAQAPALSEGFLVSDIAAADVLATLSPVGIGAEYPVTGFVAIGGKEIVEYVRDVLAGNDSSTKLLLHFDGADAATATTDSSSVPKTATANGNVQLDTSDKQFGTASSLFDGTGDYWSFADHADWTPAGDFTIDYWVSHATLTDFQTHFTHFTDATNYYQMIVSSTGSISFVVAVAGVTTISVDAPGGSIAADGEFQHVALVRNGNRFDIYVDGVSKTNTTDADSIPNFTSAFRIGANRSALNGFNGRIDEFRFSHSARWTENFTPPVSAYQVSVDVLVLLERGKFGTEASDHDEQDRVQQVIFYEGVDPALIIQDLLTSYAGIDSSLIPIASWLAETESFFRRVLTGVIAEPTPVKTLVSEIIQQAGLAVWWDDAEQQIRLQVLRAISTTADRFDDELILAGTFSSREQPEKRLSQVWTYFGQRNPLEKQDDPDNYRSVAATVDLQKESDQGSAAIEKIFSRWIPAFGRNVAERLNDIRLGRFSDPPRRFSFSTLRPTEPLLGGGYRLGWWSLQDDTGARADVPVQVTRQNPTADRFEVEAEEMLFTTYDEEDLGNRTILIDSDYLNFNFRDVHDTLYPDPESGDVVTCIIAEGVTVGSHLLGEPAFDVGDWPAGVTLNLQILGKIEGRGGKGGAAAAGTQIDDDAFEGVPGEDGSTALYTRYAITIDGTGGNVWAGGGGGGGAAGGVESFPVGGGGGGAGSEPGAGGAGFTGGAAGDPGTESEGGLGGLASSANGGDGGDPGEPGLAGGDKGELAGGAGGDAGVAVDGDSFVTWTVLPTFMGSRVN